LADENGNSIKVALREAVINAIVHNDYSFEVPPKFEIFPDRLEITSAGRLPESLTKEEFFSGISIPRNKELMRIYRDVELVESLGSGIPRILKAYGEDCFTFTDNFIRIILPVNSSVSAHESVQVSVQLKMLINCIKDNELSVDEILEVYKQVYKQVYKSKWYFKKNTIQPAITEGYVEMLYSENPNHPKQKYRLTEKGLALKETFS
jgi:predicted HTH transcriptional regulator